MTQLAKGLAATAAAQGVKLVSTFLTAVLLGRMLSPADFGAAAMVAPVAALALLAQDLGVGQAVVSARSLGRSQITALIIYSVAVNLVLSLAIVVTARVVTGFYSRDDLLPFVQATGATVFVMGIATVPAAMLQRELAFARLAFVDVVSSAVGVVASIIGAVTLRSYWAIFVGTLAAAVCQTIGLWSLRRWEFSRPSFDAEARQILGFGSRLAVFNLLNFLSRNADNVLIGRFAGGRELGYYDRAYKLLLFPLSQVNAPLGRVMLPVLARTIDRPAEYRHKYLSAVSAMLALVQPAILLLIFRSEFVIALLLGRAWLPAADIFRWLGVVGLWQVATSTLGWLFISQGRGREFMWIGAFGAVTTVLSFVAGLRWGGVGVAAAYCLTEYLVRVPVVWRQAARFGPVTLSDLLSMVRVHGAALGVAFAVALTAEFFLPSGKIGVMLVEGVGVYMAYSMGLLLTERGRCMAARYLSRALAILGGVRIR